MERIPPQNPAEQPSNQTPGYEFTVSHRTTYSNLGRVEVPITAEFQHATGAVVGMVEGGATIQEEITAAVASQMQPITINRGVSLIGQTLRTSRNGMISVVCESPDAQNRFLLAGVKGKNYRVVILNQETGDLELRSSGKPLIKNGITYTLSPLNDADIVLALSPDLNDTFTPQAMEAVSHHLFGANHDGNSLQLAPYAHELVERASRVRETRKTTGESLVALAMRVPVQPARELPPEPQPAQPSLIERIVDGIDGFFFQMNLGQIREVLAEMPPDVQRELLRELRMYGRTEQGERSIRALNALFQTDSIDQRAALYGADLKTQALRDFREQQPIWRLIDHMLDNQDKYLSSLATLLATVPLGEIPPAIVAKIKAKPLLFDLEIVPWHNNWYVCSDFEPRFEESLDLKAITVVNGNIVIKRRGKFSGLCIENSVTPNGDTFLAGVAYSPVDKETRALLDTAFDRGQTHITVPKGVWAAMRVTDIWADRDMQEELEHIRQRISRLPPRLPRRIEGMTRKQWREINKE